LLSITQAGRAIAKDARRARGTARPRRPQTAAIEPMARHPEEELATEPYLVRPRRAVVVVGVARWVVFLSPGRLLRGRFWPSAPGAFGVATLILGLLPRRGTSTRAPHRVSGPLLQAIPPRKGLHRVTQNPVRRTWENQAKPWVLGEPGLAGRAGCIHDVCAGTRPRCRLIA
jgi:hypothetical protein